ncbi:DNA (cytosine-5-)-methyltransferase [Cereibacter changlensis JA139]|uniref:Cytosine-specific methyltransferase n=2 Tax=Cereibacter changlensis TaxID=402884 RepID=A0A2T4JNW6_9RHOB|nr:DNA cytosine methyltransferase [Cereibacter changlensis]PTE19610.1 DNA (cytosine-5-)-methyltransferase [Cereibacter changlensis JA139]PZX52264.1 DNA (cytosine-5)-methyltransferase 1 [Cereibacter changlensis]
MPHSYYDFFAGGGMAGFGLGSDWQCLFANDIDAKKAASYRVNHGGGKELLLKDVAQVTADEIPGTADLVWASFPCQDLSLAGKGAGLAGKRSGMFKPFWQLVCDLTDEGRGPKMVAVENVYGAITSNGGRDFHTLAASFADLGYRFGAVVVDAVHFLPQSRPRFFIIGIRGDLRLPESCLQAAPSPVWHPPALVEGHNLLSAEAKERWVWWNLPVPASRESTLAELIEEDPKGVTWHSKAETAYLLSLMTDLNRKKVEAAKQLGTRKVGTVYRRTRPDADGVKRQRAEVRFDDIAGCLRTPSGGSSRQTIMVVEGRSVRSRLLSPREAMALMGLPESFILPERYNDAYKLAGDGVAVPVVRHLAQGIFEPVLKRNRLALVA